MSTIIIDVREPWEFAAGHAQSAINVPMGEIFSGSKKILNLPKDTELVLYCNSGNRSGTCKKVLNTHGFTNVVNGMTQRAVEHNYQQK